MQGQNGIVMGHHRSIARARNELAPPGYDKLPGDRLLQAPDGCDVDVLLAHPTE